jgi:hypothetical protein
MFAPQPETVYRLSSVLPYVLFCQHHVAGKVFAELMVDAGAFTHQGFS